MSNPLARDLDHVLEHTAGLWDELRWSRLFITGGTGFFGCWLLETFTWANDRLGLGASATVLTRDPAAFRAKAPHLARHTAVQLCAGDVRTFEFPRGEFSHVVHAATASTAQTGASDLPGSWQTIVEGTQRTLEFARACGARKFLLASSGAVYGAQPAGMTHVPEDYAGAPDVLRPSAAYGEGKRIAELLCALYGEEYGLAVKVARGFAFCGPYLPLDAHFAVGNFVRDALRGGPIQVQGDGTPYRSYLYAADLAIWLWTILLRGEPGRAYNVGSQDALTIAELAEQVASAVTPRPAVLVARAAEAGRPAQRYVPSTRRATEELGLRQWIDLPEALHRMIDWHVRRRERLAAKETNFNG